MCGSVIAMAGFRFSFNILDIGSGEKLAATCRRGEGYGYGRTMTAEELLDTPFVLIGTVEQMAEQVLRNRERFGFTYYTVHGPYMEAFAPVIERVRALDTAG